MSNNGYPNIKLLVNRILTGSIFSGMKECRKNFIVVALLCFASVKGKKNFLQFERFSEKSEQYFRINFENRFDFQKFNAEIIQEKICGESIVAFDPGYIKKSGKETYGLGMYWSGCAGKAKQGLEICGFAAVDVSRNTAFHLNAVQTPAHKFEGMTLQRYYCQTVRNNYLYLRDISAYLVADAYFAISEVVECITSSGLHFISRLRDNAALYYIYAGPRKKGRGAPKKYDGKVSVKEPDMKHFKICLYAEEIKIYNATVYSKAFKRNINLSIAVFYKNGKEVARKLYFSTDLKQDGVKTVKYYRSRFQIEFLYRDAKQHCGLEDCQARSRNKLDFHFNAALTVVNLAKIHWLDTRKTDDEPFSMANFKTLLNNKLLLDRFIREFAINPNSKINKQKIEKLCNFGIIT